MSCSTAALLIMSVSRCEMSWGVSTSLAKWGETRLIKRSEELRLSPSRLFERCKYKQFAGTVQIFEEKRPFYAMLCAQIVSFRELHGFFFKRRRLFASVASRLVCKVAQGVREGRRRLIFA